MKKIKCHYCKKEIGDNNIINIEISKKSNKFFHKNEKCYNKYVFEKSNKCKICKKKILHDENYVKSNNNKYYHKNCFEENEFKIKEKEELDKIYSFVKEKILQYPEGVSLSRHQVLMIKELREGKFLMKNSTQEYCGYSYMDIYYTFVLHQQKILNSLNGKHFDNENLKFSYIMAIIKNNINDIVLKRIEKEETDEKIKNIKIEEPIETDYVKKSVYKEGLTKLILENRW